MEEEKPKRTRSPESIEKQRKTFAKTRARKKALEASANLGVVEQIITVIVAGKLRSFTDKAEACKYLLSR